MARSYKQHNCVVVGTKRSPGLGRPSLKNNGLVNNTPSYRTTHTDHAAALPALLHAVLGASASAVLPTAQTSSIPSRRSLT